MLKHFKKSHYLIIAALVIVAILFFVWHQYGRVSLTHQQKTAISVTVSKPTVKLIAEKLTAVGSIDAMQQANLSAKNAGYIQKIFFKEGQYVKAGTALIQLDSTQAASQLQADKTALTIAANQYKTDQSLYKKELISRNDMESDHATYANDLAKVVADQKTLDEMTIRAPFSGYLGAKTVSIGDYVAAAQKLILLVDRDHLLAEYSLPARYAPLLKLGSPVTVITNTTPKIKIAGTVEYIAPEINVDTRTINVHAAITDSKHQLLPGQYVTVKQTLTQPHQVLFVPEQSVLESLQGNSVFVAKQGKAAKLKVSLGQRRNGLVEVTQGLQVNDLVITAGQHLLKAGQAVKVAKS